MKKVLLPSIIGFLLSMSSVLAAFSYTEYAGSGDFLIKSNIANMEDKAEGSADEYSGIQILTNNYDDCGKYEICSYDESHIDNGFVDLQQLIIDENGDGMYQTTYNTGLEGTGSAYSMVFSSSYDGYSYQESDAEGNTYSYFTQSHYTNSDFDYEVGYGGGTEECDNGTVYLENGYELGYFPAVYTTPIFLDPECQGTGCNFITLYGNATDLLSLEAYFNSSDLTFSTNMVSNGISMFDLYGESDYPVDFDFEMVIE